MWHSICEYTWHSTSRVCEDAKLMFVLPIIFSATLSNVQDVRICSIVCVGWAKKILKRSALPISSNITLSNA